MKGPATVKPPAHLVGVLGGLPMPFAAPVEIFAFVVWLVGLAAVTLLWQPTANAFFKAALS